MKTFFYLRLIVTLFFACIVAIIRANDNNNEEVCVHILFSETVLLNHDEEYVKDTRIKLAPNSHYCKCNIADSTFTIKDTLCGRCMYLLYYDTTDLAVGKELQRTKDSLFMIYCLNREVSAYNSEEVANAPREIIVADSLIRDYLHPKRLWMDILTPAVIPFHQLNVDFVIEPFYVLQYGNDTQETTNGQ